MEWKERTTEQTGLKRDRGENSDLEEEVKEIII